MSSTTETRQNSSQTRKRKDLSLSRLRSSITNGSQLFVGEVDERGAWCRRLRDLINDHIADLGGEDMVSSSEMILIRRASMLCLQLEMMESRWAAEREGQAGPKSLELYQRATGALRRTLESLGLKRRPRDVTPSLDEYLRAKHRLAEDADYEEVEA